MLLACAAPSRTLADRRLLSCPISPPTACSPARALATALNSLMSGRHAILHRFHPRCTRVLWVSAVAAASRSGGAKMWLVGFVGLFVRHHRSPCKRRMTTGRTHNQRHIAPARQSRSQMLRFEENALVLCQLCCLFYVAFPEALSDS